MIAKPINNPYLCMIYKHKYMYIYIYNYRNIHRYVYIYTYVCMYVWQGQLGISRPNLCIPLCQTHAPASWNAVRSFNRSKYACCSVLRAKGGLYLERPAGTSILTNWNREHLWLGHCKNYHLPFIGVASGHFGMLLILRPTLCCSTGNSFFYSHASHKQAFWKMGTY